MKSFANIILASYSIQLRFHEFRFVTTSNKSNKVGQLPWQVVRSISFLFHPWVRHYFGQLCSIFSHMTIRRKQLWILNRHYKYLFRHILQGTLLRGIVNWSGTTWIWGTKTKTTVSVTFSFVSTWNRNSNLLPKLFWPTVRKNCSSDQEKLFEIQGWRPRIWKIFEITRTIYSNSERSEQFLVTECFFNLFLEISPI